MEYSSRYGKANITNLKVLKLYNLEKYWMLIFQPTFVFMSKMYTYPFYECRSIFFFFPSLFFTMNLLTRELIARTHYYLFILSFQSTFRRAIRSRFVSNYRMLIQWNKEPNTIKILEKYLYTIFREWGEMMQNLIVKPKNN